MTTKISSSNGEGKKNKENCPEIINRGFITEIQKGKTSAEETPEITSKPNSEPNKEKLSLTEFLDEIYEKYVTLEILLLFYRNEYIMEDVNKIARTIGRDKYIDIVGNILNKLVDEEILEKIGGSGFDATYCLIGISAEKEDKNKKEEFMKKMKNLKEKLTGKRKEEK